MKKYSLFLLLFVTINTFAQPTVKTYSGEMEMNEQIIMIRSHYLSNPGTGKYSYYTDADGTRIKHGPYSFINEGEKDVQKYNSVSAHAHNLSVKGQFVNGKKEGKWQINYEENTYIINYKNDQFNGDFTIKSRENPSYVIKCHFKDNHFTGSFSMTSDWVYTGQFDENGYADGLWTIKEKSESRFEYYYKYYHGVLEKAYRIDNSTGEKTDLKDKGISNSYGSYAIVLFRPVFPSDLGTRYLKDYFNLGPFDFASPAIR